MINFSHIILASFLQQECNSGKDEDHDVQSFVVSRTETGKSRIELEKQIEDSADEEGEYSLNMLS